MKIAFLEELRLVHGVPPHHLETIRKALESSPPAGPTLGEHRARTIDALLTAIDGHITSTRDIGAIEALARAVVSLAGAPL